ENLVQHRAENAARFAGETAAARLRRDRDRFAADIVQLQAGMDIALRAHLGEHADAIERAQARAVEREAGADRTPTRAEIDEFNHTWLPRQTDSERHAANAAADDQDLANARHRGPPRPGR